MCRCLLLTAAAVIFSPSVSFAFQEDGEVTQCWNSGGGTAPHHVDYYAIATIENDNSFTRTFKLVGEIQRKLDGSSNFIFYASNTATWDLPAHSTKNDFKAEGSNTLPAGEYRIKGTLYFVSNTQAWVWLNEYTNYTSFTVN